MTSSSNPSPTSEAINFEDTLTDAPVPQDLDSDVHAIRELPSFVDDDFEEQTQVHKHMRDVVAADLGIDPSDVIEAVQDEVQNVAAHDDDAVWLDPDDLREVTEVPADCLVRGFDDDDK